MDFSEKIRKARMAKEMSQKELAKATGLSERTIQNYELGSRLPKSRDTYVKLAEALDISTDMLLDDQASFILTATENYGARGRQQAIKLLDNFRAPFAAAGGTFNDDDMDFMLDAITQTFKDAKEYNQRFRNTKKDGGE